MTIKEICALFELDGKYVSCSEIPTGNVNSTYEVEFINGEKREKYVLQKINRTAFKNPPEVMENIVRVTEHIRKKVGDQREHSDVLQAFVARKKERYYIIDDHDEYWRCYRFIDNAVTHDVMDSLDKVYEVGVAFGQFQNYLQDFDAGVLHTTIPDFHNTIKRFEAFHRAVELNPRNRVRKVVEQIDDLIALEKKACELQKDIDQGQIPCRVTHNDTKCNNVCFDKDTEKALAVLDLDTVMPGAVAHDFGDAIRSIASTIVEDDPRVEEVALDLEKYRAFTKGFVSQVKDVLNEREKKTLNLGVIAMTVEVAVRFLTDYLLGDVYFKTKYPGHNVDRATNQIALAKNMVENFDKMQEILQEYV